MEAYNILVVLLVYFYVAGAMIVRFVHAEVEGHPWHRPIASALWFLAPFFILNNMVATADDDDNEGV